MKFLLVLRDRLTTSHRRALTVDCNASRKHIACEVFTAAVASWNALEEELDKLKQLTDPDRSPERHVVQIQTRHRNLCAMASQSMTWNTVHVLVHDKHQLSQEVHTIVASVRDR